MYILDATHSADDAGYAGIDQLLGTTTPKTTLDTNPLFTNTELYIVGLLPDAALRDPAEQGKGRMYPHRNRVIAALQFLFVAAELQAGGTGASRIDASGAVKSVTQSFDGETYSESYETGQKSVISRSADDRAKYYQEQGDAILVSLGATLTPSGIDADTAATVTLTRSRL